MTTKGGHTSPKPPLILDYKKTSRKDILWKALAIACIVHLLFFLLFTIKKNTFDGAHIHCPITVAAKRTHYHTSDTIAMSQIDVQGLLQQHIIPPPPPLPHLPQLTAIPPALYSDSELTFQREYPSFDQLENIPYYTDPQSFPCINENPITINVSGPLSDRALCSDGLSHIDTTPYQIDDIDYRSLMYDVQVENANGMIFWSQVKTPSSEEWINTIGDDIIAHMSFECSYDNTFITRGTVQIIFAL